MMKIWFIYGATVALALPIVHGQGLIHMAFEVHSEKSLNVTQNNMFEGLNITNNVLPQKVLEGAPGIDVGPGIAPPPPPVHGGKPPRTCPRGPGKGSEPK